MAASQAAVETGGKSSARFRISVGQTIGFRRLSTSGSGMGALLHDLEQIAEGGGFGGLGMQEEHRGAARSLARRLVDDLEAALFQVIEGLLYVGHAQGDVRHAAASAILLNLF